MATVNKLFLYDADLRKNAQAFAKLIGHQGATFNEINSWKGFRNQISRYSRIHTLIIYAHGYRGGVFVGHEARDLGDKSVRLLFAGIKTRIKRIEFEGCHIGEAPAQMAAFAELFGAKTAVAFNWAGWSGDISVTVPQGVTKKDMRTVLKPFERWMIGTTLTSLTGRASRRDYNANLLLVWHTYELSRKTPPYVDNAFTRNPRAYKARGDASNVKIKASALKPNKDPAPLFKRVTVLL